MRKARWPDMRYWGRSGRRVAETAVVVPPDADGEGTRIPLGAAKWMTLPSDLNMLTSSMAWIGWVLSFFNAAWSFLSSVPDDLWTFLTLRRGVPLPLNGNIC